jgi:hypothetical protein
MASAARPAGSMAASMPESDRTPVLLPSRGQAFAASAPLQLEPAPRRSRVAPSKPPISRAVGGRAGARPPGWPILIDEGRPAGRPRASLAYKTLLRAHCSLICGLD